MSKKKKSLKKNSKKKELKEDLQKFSQDCEKILAHHELVEDVDFLHKFAEDIKYLDEDASLFEKDPSAKMIHYYLSTPMGAPFVSTKTLLEAASSYRHQDPLESDLHELVDGMIHFGVQKKNPLLILFHSIEEYLEKENSKD